MFWSSAFLAGGALGVLGAKKYLKRRREPAPWLKHSRSQGTSNLQIEAANQPSVPNYTISTSGRLTHFGNILRQLKEKPPRILSKAAAKDLRRKQWKEISLDAEELSTEEALANHRFSRASVLLGSTLLCTLIYPPLTLLHIPILFVEGIPIYREALQDLFTKHRVTSTVTDAILILGFMGFSIYMPSILVMSAAGGWVYAFTNRLIIKTQNHTRQNLTNLFGEQPQTVWLAQNGIELEVPFESVKEGDVIVIDAGQVIPVDGFICAGIASIDQHMLTGEAQPAEKGVGAPVFAATVVLTGRIYLQIEKRGAETAAAQIAEILSQTSSFTSSVQLRGKEISDRFALPTLTLSLMTSPLLGFNRALAILISGFGYNMKVLGPLSVLNFLQYTARHGILIKDGRALEQISKVDTIVFDKTGTLTLEQPHVGTIYSCHDTSAESILTYAATAEQRQTHPIANAIQQAAQEQGISLPPIHEAAYEIGYGIKVKMGEQQILVGSTRFMAMEDLTIPADLQLIEATAHAQGYSLVYVAVDGRVEGAIELRPTLRPEAKRIIEELHHLGLDLYIISGDHEGPTRALATQLGIDRYLAETLPENKAALIARLQDEGRCVVFVGDGINDSIALQKAQVSISLHGASTIATDTAQIILMDQTLCQLGELFAIATQYEFNMQRNLLASFAPGVIITGGAMLGVVGLPTAMVLGTAGYVLGLFNAMYPLLHDTPDDSFTTT